MVCKVNNVVYDVFRNKTTQNGKVISMASIDKFDDNFFFSSYQFSCNFYPTIFFELKTWTKYRRAVSDPNALSAVSVWVRIKNSYQMLEMFCIEHFCSLETNCWVVWNVTLILCRALEICLLKYLNSIKNITYILYWIPKIVILIHHIPEITFDTNHKPINIQLSGSKIVISQCNRNSKPYYIWSIFLVEKLSHR